VGGLRGVQQEPLKKQKRIDDIGDKERTVEQNGMGGEKKRWRRRKGKMRARSAMSSNNEAEKDRKGGKRSAVVNRKGAEDGWGGRKSEPYSS